MQIVKNAIHTAVLWRRYWTILAGTLVLALALAAREEVWTAVAAPPAFPEEIAAAGDLDDTFDSDGVLIEPLQNGPGGDRQANAILVKDDGTIIIAKQITETVTGRIVPSLLFYNANGVLQNERPAVIGNQPQTYTDLAIDNNGNLIVVGYLVNQQQGQQDDFIHLRLDNNLQPLQGGPLFTGLFNGSNDRASAVAVEPNTGAIIVAGYSNFNNQDHFAWIRLNANGVLDTSIGNNGRVTTPIGSNARILEIAIQSDGKIVAVGYANTNGADGIVVARYNTNGVLDNSFDGDGVRYTPTPNVNARATDVIIQQDGRLVVFGYGKTNNGPYAISMTRYNPNGSTDQSFGQNGVFRPTLQGDAFATRLLQQQDRKLVAVGYIHDGGDHDFLLLRANANGQVDSQFGNNGVVTTDLLSFGGKDDRVYDATLQNDGKIIVAGSTDPNPQQQFVFSQAVLARYEASSGAGSNTATLNGLQKGAASSIYQVINMGSGAAQTAHQFYDSTNQLIYTHPAMIAPGGTIVVNLANLAQIPSGYQGYVVITANQPIAAQLGTTGPTPTATATTEPTPSTPTPTNTPGGTIPPLTPTATPTLPASDESAIAQPDQPASLSYSSSNGGSTQVTIPAGAVDQPTTFLYTEEETTPDSGGRFRFAGRTFTLTAYQDNTAVDGFTFLQPVTIVIEYTDADVAGLDETQLTLFYYNTASGHWSTDGITVVARDPANNRITLRITHLTEFALAEPNALIFLPQVNR